MVVAFRDGFTGIAIRATNPGFLDRLRRIRSIQSGIPHIAQIADIVDDVVVCEMAEGCLVWEEEQPPNCDAIEPALRETVAALGAANLVHCDIRPWNIFFSREDSKITLIDWSLSFFVDEPTRHSVSHIRDRGHAGTRETEIDPADIQKTLDVLRGHATPESQWNHPYSEFSWRPEWCR